VAFNRDVRVCPVCGKSYKRTKIIETKTSDDGYLVRYRKCGGCKVIYKTFELQEKEFKLSRGVFDLALEFVRNGLDEDKKEGIEEGA